MPFKTEFVSICIYMIIFLSVVGVDKEETSQAKGKRRIVDLRFGNVRAKAESLRIHYQEEDQVLVNVNLNEVEIGNHRYLEQKGG